MTSIANAIRSKTGGSATMTPGQMPAQIASIPVGTLGIPREVDANGVYGMPARNLTFALPPTAKNIGGYVLTNAFYGCATLTSVDLSSLTTISGSSALDSAFYGCYALTSVDLSSLTTVSGSSALNNVFRSCSALASVDLSSLTTVSGSYAFYYAFYSCISFTSIDLSSLTTISGGSAFSYAFYGCTGLTSVSFPALTTISGSSALSNAFQSCTGLTSVSFPALTTSSFGYNTNQFNNMLRICSGVTVHFPAAIQSTIGSWSDVTNGFGGTNTTVLFDL